MVVVGSGGRLSRRCCCTARCAVNGASRGHAPVSAAAARLDLRLVDARRGLARCRRGRAVAKAISAAPRRLLQRQRQMRNSSSFCRAKASQRCSSAIERRLSLSRSTGHMQQRAGRRDSSRFAATLSRAVVDQARSAGRDRSARCCGHRRCRPTAPCRGQSLEPPSASLFGRAHRIDMQPGHRQLPRPAQVVEQRRRNRWPAAASGPQRASRHRCARRRGAAPPKIERQDRLVDLHPLRPLVPSAPPAAAHRPARARRAAKRSKPAPLALPSHRKVTGPSSHRPGLDAQRLGFANSSSALLVES